MEHQAAAPPEVLNVIKFLRSPKAKVATKVGVLNGKRQDYFRGQSAIKALLSPEYAKLKNVLPQPTSQDQAIQMLQQIIPFAFFLLVERGNKAGSSAGSPRHLQLVSQQSFKLDGYFAWFWEGSQWTTYLGGIAMILVLLGGVMYPLWPPFLRMGAYYLSLAMFGLVGLFIAIAILRLIFYVITIVVASPGIWIFPKLFADVGVIESFIPFWAWDIPEKKKKKRKVKGAQGEELIAEDTNGALKRKTKPTSNRTAQPNSRIEEVEDDSE